MSDFLERTASVIRMTPRRSNAVAFLQGNLQAPLSAPANGFIETLMFLDRNDALRPGDSLSTALQRLGVAQIDQTSRDYTIMPHGAFANGVVSVKAKELLDVLAQDGFTGEITYLADGVDQTAVLYHDGLRLSESPRSFKAG